MKHLVIIAAGSIWGAVALSTYFCFGLQAADLPRIAPSVFGCAVATAYLVTWTFRRALRDPRTCRNLALPFLTIATGVSSWVTLSFIVAAISSVVHGRHDVFDGFFYALVVAMLLMLTLALPVTYPLAYATQRLIGRALADSLAGNAGP
jgi:hypothetical protein